MFGLLPNEPNHQRLTRGQTPACPSWPIVDLCRGPWGCESLQEQAVRRREEGIAELILFSPRLYVPPFLYLSTIFSSSFYLHPISSFLFTFFFLLLCNGKKSAKGRYIDERQREGVKKKMRVGGGYEKKRDDVRVTPQLNLNKLNNSSI